MNTDDKIHVVKATPFDMSEYLESPEMIKEYINAAIETGKPELLRQSIGDVARAIEADAGESIDGLRESLAEMYAVKIAQKYTPEQ